MWSHLKSSITSFATDFSQRLNVDGLAVQMAYKYKVDRAIKSGNSGEVAIARVAQECLLRQQTWLLNCKTTSTDTVPLCFLMLL